MCLCATLMVWNINSDVDFSNRVVSYLFGIFCEIGCSKTVFWLNHTKCEAICNMRWSVLTQSAIAWLSSTMVLLITQKDFNMFIHCEFFESNVFVTFFSLHQIILYPLSSMYRMFVKSVAVLCWISLKYSKILVVIR